MLNYSFRKKAAGVWEGRGVDSAGKENEGRKSDTAPKCLK